MRVVTIWVDGICICTVHQTGLLTPLTFPLYLPSTHNFPSGTELTLILDKASKSKEKRKGKAIKYTCNFFHMYIYGHTKACKFTYLTNEKGIGTQVYIAILGIVSG